MATARVTHDGENWRIGKDGTATLKLKVFYNPATEGAAEVEIAALQNLPSTWGVYMLRSVDLDWSAFGIYEARGNYTRAQPNNPDAPTGGDPPEFSFEITAQQVKVMASLAVMSSGQAAGKTIPNHGNLIGVQEDGTIEGVEVPQMVYSFSESWYFASVSPSYKIMLAGLVGTVNFGAAFRSFAAGAVLATGVSGSQQGDELWKLRFTFAVIPNTINLTIGGITGINKAGWDYIEWYSDEKVNATTKRIERELLGYRVHRVIRTGAFASFGIGTA